MPTIVLASLAGTTQKEFSLEHFVLNDDTVAAGMGFGTHPHDNMEIIQFL
jgi:redox-sensitive bicupin YhaK (pirin superfamily)